MVDQIIANLRTWLSNMTNNELHDYEYVVICDVLSVPSPEFALGIYFLIQDEMDKRFGKR